MDGSIWYFAYGANMSRRVLARRGLVPVSSEAAVLASYRLRFSHRGLLPVEPAFANIEPHADGAVHGVLHRLSPEQMDRLDRLEGAEYLHEEVTVIGTASGAVRARAYLDPHPVAGRTPSRRYLGTLCDGAREFGLPYSYVSELMAHPCRHVPILSDVTTLLVGLAERVRLAGFRPERVGLLLRGQRGRR